MFFFWSLVSIASSWLQPSIVSEVFYMTSGHILPPSWPRGYTLPMHFTPPLRSFHLSQISLTCLANCPTNRGFNPSCHRRRILPEGPGCFCQLQRQPLEGTGRAEVGTPCSMAARGPGSVRPRGERAQGELKVSSVIRRLQNSCCINLYPAVTTRQKLGNSNRSSLLLQLGQPHCAGEA